MRRGILGGAALALCALAAAPAAAQTLATTAGSWVKVFALDVERTLGRSVRVDTASIVPGGLGRTFRQAEVMNRASRAYPRGTTRFALRSVDCTGGRVVTSAWQVVGPTGTALGTSAGASTVVRVNWDSEDGKVLRYICQGILPR
ncbi:hypothetical protein [Novosphingobium sp. AP12]|uniref:hypothetical protein n=1 Tax=Novosphingobium sp. AP12 TaxID=1144305 RepID=UPI000272147F|nr:hypothetical protein [Novosphingobium sp. AP12]EJL33850.1 hypothetical protein PMI02_00934 [Novosphingobium sp. AP12]